MPSFVKRHWRANPEALGGRRSRRGFIYDAFVPDELADVELALPADVVEAADRAAAALTALGARPSGHVSWQALGRHLLRAESLASSRIEGIELSYRRLARAAFGRAHRDATAESVLGNVAAMEAAIHLGARRTLAPHDMQAIHRTLFRAAPDHQLAGRLRTSQGWVGGGSTPADAEFVPPPEDLVPGLLDDLCGFASREDVPAVIQAAIVHAQFETIHPFPDGNGRVGRCLVHTILARRGLVSGVAPPISLVLDSNASAYVRGLVAFREGRVAEWCGAFSASVGTAAAEADRLRRSLEGLQDRWRAAAGEPREASTASHVIEALPGHPIVDVAAVETLAGASTEAARRAIEALEAAGVVRRIGMGKGDGAWEAVGLFELVDAFEQRLLGRQAPRPQ